MRGVYQRDRVSKRARLRIRIMAGCQHSAEAAGNVERKRAKFQKRREARLEALRRERALYLSVKAHLDRIAWCESKGNIRAIGGGGAFRGKYQFTFGTWASVGGSGDPAAAPEQEQDKRAAMLLKRDGAGHWPVCG